MKIRYSLWPWIRWKQKRCCHVWGRWIMRPATTPADKAFGVTICDHCGAERTIPAAGLMPPNISADLLQIQEDIHADLSAAFYLEDRMGEYPSRYLKQQMHIDTNPKVDRTWLEGTWKRTEDGIEMPSSEDLLNDFEFYQAPPLMSKPSPDRYIGSFDDAILAVIDGQRVLYCCSHRVHDENYATLWSAVQRRFGDDALRPTRPMPTYHLNNGGALTLLDPSDDLDRFRGYEWHRSNTIPQRLIPYVRLAL